MTIEDKAKLLLTSKQYRSETGIHDMEETEAVGYLIQAFNEEDLDEMIKEMGLDIPETLEQLEAELADYVDEMIKGGSVKSYKTYGYYKVLTKKINKLKSITQ